MTRKEATNSRRDEPGPEYRRGVGILLLNPAGHAFAAERIDTPGAWQLPQGGIDKGETPMQAAWRELEEESGVTDATLLAETEGWLHYDLPEHVRGNVWKGRYVGQAQKWFAMRFEGSDDSIRIDGDHPEFSAWRWVAPATLPSLIVPFKRPLYEALLVEFSALLGTSPGPD